MQTKTMVSSSLFTVLMISSLCASFLFPITHAQGTRTLALPAATILYDDFENSQLKWFFTGSGTPVGSVSLTTSFPQIFDGAQALKVTTSTQSGQQIGLAYRYLAATNGVGSEPDDIAGTGNNLGSGQYSLRMWFKSPGYDPQATTIYFDPTGYDGTNYHEAELRWQAGNWQLVQSFGAGWTNVTSGTNPFPLYSGDASMWNYISYSWDWNANRFISLTVNGIYFNLAKYTLTTSTSSNPAATMVVKMGCNNGSSSAAANCYFDDVLLASIPYNNPISAQLGVVPNGLAMVLAASMLIGTPTAIGLALFRKVKQSKIR